MHLHFLTHGMLMLDIHYFAADMDSGIDSRRESMGTETEGNRTFIWNRCGLQISQEIL